MLNTDAVNYVDALIVLVLFFYVVANVRRGFFVITADLAALVLSILLAFRFYSSAESLIDRIVSIPDAFGPALGFLAILLLAQITLGWAARRVLQEIPVQWHRTPLSQALSVVPALAHGMVLLGAFLLLLLALPTDAGFKSDVRDARIAGAMLERADRAEEAFIDVFGGVIQEGIDLLTVRTGSTESIDLPARPDATEVNEAAEAEMLDLVNQARAEHGLEPLEVDPTIVPVAREHSRDMWARGYFSHVNPDGDDPFDRMRAGDVDFAAAGENLALAPDTVTAHEGLMDSPGHRRNILDETYTRIGIGVIDGGPHGMMYTQLFAN